MVILRWVDERYNLHPPALQITPPLKFGEKLLDSVQMVDVRLEWASVVFWVPFSRVWVPCQKMMNFRNLCFCIPLTLFFCVKTYKLLKMHEKLFLQKIGPHKFNKLANVLWSRFYINSKLSSAFNVQLASSVTKLSAWACLTFYSPDSYASNFLQPRWLCF